MTDPLDKYLTPTLDDLSRDLEIDLAGVSPDDFPDYDLCMVLVPDDLRDDPDLEAAMEERFRVSESTNGRCVLALCEESGAGVIRLLDTDG